MGRNGGRDLLRSDECRFVVKVSREIELTRDVPSDRPLEGKFPVHLADHLEITVAAHVLWKGDIELGGDFCIGPWPLLSHVGVVGRGQSWGQRRLGIGFEIATRHLSTVLGFLVFGGQRMLSAVQVLQVVPGPRRAFFWGCLFTSPTSQNWGYLVGSQY